MKIARTYSLFDLPPAPADLVPRGPGHYQGGWEITEYPAQWRARNPKRGTLLVARNRDDLNRAIAIVEGKV